MNIKTGVVIGAVLVAGFSMTVLAGKKDAVEVCHVTGSGASFVLSVSGAAVAAHLGHGDSLDLNNCGDGGVIPR